MIHVKATFNREQEAPAPCMVPGNYTLEYCLRVVVASWGETENLHRILKC